MTYDGPRHVKAFTEFVLETLGLFIAFIFRHKFVEAHPIKMVPSKLQLITKVISSLVDNMCRDWMPSFRHI